MVFLDILHHDVQCLLRMGGGPLPAFPAGLGETACLLLVPLIVLAGHIDTVLLHVVAVVAEAVHVLVGHPDACLHQLVVLIVTHGQRGVEGTGHKQVDVLGKAHPLVVQMVLDAHADGQLPEARTPDANLGTLQRQRVFVAGRHDDYRVVHRRLQDIDQRDAVVNNLQGLAYHYRRGLAHVVAQSGNGGLRG